MRFNIPGRAMLGIITAISLTFALAPRTSAEDVDRRWLDGGLSSAERALLDYTVGYAPPALTEDVSFEQGEPMTWEDLRGKVVVIQSWTRDNEVGRAATRRVQLLLRKHDPSDVQIIALHTPEGVDGLDTYLERRDVGVPVLVDRAGHFCDDLGIYDRPTTLVIDRQGVIRYTGLGFRGIREAVEKLIAEPYDPEAEAPEPVPSRDKWPKDLVASDARQADFPPIRGAITVANDLRGQKAPEVTAQHWLTTKPDLEGKVIMVDLWATWCGPCRASIPDLNAYQKRYDEKLVVVGLSNEEQATVRNFMRGTRMNYAVGVDQGKGFASVVAARAIPHALIISPDGIVRWQGNPHSLQDHELEQIIEASFAGQSAPGGPRWVTSDSRE